jgi:hypothetical protein
MVKNHANDESQMTCERQWPDLNPSKSLFWFRFLNNMEWQPQRSHTFDILLMSSFNYICYELVCTEHHFKTISVLMSSRGNLIVTHYLQLLLGTRLAFNCICGEADMPIPNECNAGN